MLLTRLPSRVAAVASDGSRVVVGHERHDSLVLDRASGVVATAVPGAWAASAQIIGGVAYLASAAGGGVTSFRLGDLADHPAPAVADVKVVRGLANGGLVTGGRASPIAIWTAARSEVRSFGLKKYLNDLDAGDELVVAAYS